MSTVMLVPSLMQFVDSLANSYERHKPDKKHKDAILSNMWMCGGTVQTRPLFVLTASSLHLKTNPQAINQCQDMKVQTRARRARRRSASVVCSGALLFPQISSRPEVSDLR